MTATEHREYVNSLSCAMKCLDRAETLLQNTHERNDQTRAAAKKIDAIGCQLQDLQTEDFLEAGA